LNTGDFHDVRTTTHAEPKSGTNMSMPNVERRTRNARRLVRRALQYAVAFLLLSAVPASAQNPTIELPPSYTLEVLDAAASQQRGVVSVSGWVRLATPWAGTSFGCLEVSLLDNGGNLIKKLRVDYFPKPMHRIYHSADEHRAFFAVNVDVGSQSVASVRIVYHD